MSPESGKDFTTESIGRDARLFQSPAGKAKRKTANVVKP
jgi:hypothetical protein